MTTMDNKQLMQDIFSKLAKGDKKLLIEALAEDVEWTHMGTLTWSRIFRGKETLRKDLLEHIDWSKAVADHFIAEGDHVVVEARGYASVEGKPYDNKYCWVCRIAEGKIKEVREYMDTELVTAIFRNYEQ